jgi:hypothetical protein
MNHAQEVSGGGIVRGVLGLFGGVFDSACKLGGFLWGILW